MTYSFELKIPVKKAGATAFSCPQSNEYQHISKLAITPPMQKNYTFIKPTTIKFEATLLANNKTIPNKLSLHDYSSSQKKTLVNDSYVNGLDPKIISFSKEIKGETVSEIISCILRGSHPSQFLISEHLRYFLQSLEVSKNEYADLKDLVTTPEPVVPLFHPDSLLSIS